MKLGQLNSKSKNQLGYRLNGILQEELLLELKARLQEETDGTSLLQQLLSLEWAVTNLLHPDSVKLEVVLVKHQHLEDGLSQHL